MVGGGVTEATEAEEEGRDCGGTRWRSCRLVVDLKFWFYGTIWGWGGGGHRIPRKKGLISMSDDLRHSGCPCIWVNTMPKHFERALFTSNKRLRATVAAFNDDFKWSFVEEMDRDTLPPSPSLAA